MSVPQQGTNPCQADTNNVNRRFQRKLQLCDDLHVQPNQVPADSHTRVQRRLNQMNHTSTDKASNSAEFLIVPVVQLSC